MYKICYKGEECPNINGFPHCRYLNAFLHIILLNCGKKNVGLTDAVQILIVIDNSKPRYCPRCGDVLSKIVDVINNYYFNNFLNFFIHITLIKIKLIFV